MLRGYELQTTMYRIAIPLAVLFGGIGAVFAWLAIEIGANTGRTVLLVVATAFVSMALVLVLRAYLARRFLNAYHTIFELRQMDSIQFEHYVANLFRKRGYSAKVTVASGDDGVDVQVSKNGEKAVVQCKRYAESNCVGSEEIQRFIGSMQIYKVRKGFFVATTRFTAHAVRLAHAHHVELIDDVRLAEMIRKVFPKTER